MFFQSSSFYFTQLFCWGTLSVACLLEQMYTAVRKPSGSRPLHRSQPLYSFVGFLRKAAQFGEAFGVKRRAVIKGSAGIEHPGRNPLKRNVAVLICHD